MLVASRTDWRPGATLPVMRARAQLLRRVRDFFAARDVLEVETPLLGRAFGTDPAIQPFVVREDTATWYLQSSPEFYMKRLLAADSGPIYQISKAFRQGEAGRRHNPEFTLLEWYRPGFSAVDLMDELADLMRYLLGTVLEVQNCPYAELFAQTLQLDIFAADAGALRDCAVAQQIPDAADLVLERDAWLDLLWAECIEPQLPPEQLTFVTDYPASQAALAELNAQDPRTAARFELYYAGLELANGFQELTDAAAQAARFNADNVQRQRAGQPILPLDTRFIAALQHGLPRCAGVAVGLDRVLLAQLELSSLDQVQTFATERA